MMAMRRNQSRSKHCKTSKVQEVSMLAICKNQRRSAVTERDNGSRNERMQAQRPRPVRKSARLAAREQKGLAAEITAEALLAEYTCPSAFNCLKRR